MEKSPPLVVGWTQALSDLSIQRSVCEHMKTHGYVVLQIDSSQVKLMEQLRKATGKFFRKSTLGMSLHRYMSYLGGRYEC